MANISELDLTGSTTHDIENLSSPIPDLKEGDIVRLPAGDQYVFRPGGNFDPVTSDTTTPEDTGKSSFDELIEQAQNILTGEDGFLSSDTSDIDQFITGTVTELRSGQAARAR